MTLIVVFIILLRQNSQTYSVPYECSHSILQTKPPSTEKIRFKDGDVFTGKMTNIMNSAPFTKRVPRNDVYFPLIDYLERAKIPGDYVETGVYQGKSAIANAGYYKKKGITKKMWLYDAWKGMPATVKGDNPLASKLAGKWGKDSSAQMVLDGIKRTGYDLSNIQIRKGWFSETFDVDPMPTQVSFLHIDSDWYQSVLDTLNTFFDLVPIGGVIVFDDFGYWEGARLAYYEFCFNRGMAPLLERNGHTQAYFIKGKEHNRGNRDYSGI